MKNFTKSTKDIFLIKAIEGVKIKNFAGLIEIGDILFILYSLTGLNKNNYPNKDESILLGNFIHSDFGNFTIEEIKLAFTLAIKKELTQFMGKGESIEHFQTFSPVYFSKIMIGYKKYKEHNLKPLLAKVSSMPIIPEKSDYDFIISNFVNQFDKFKNGQYPWRYGADVMIFEILVNHEIINISDSEKKEIHYNIIRPKLVGKEYSNQNEFETDWLNKTKIYFFKKYIDEVVEFDVDLLELIKDKIK